MKVATFRIRRRIIQAFLFCLLAILIFAGLSFQAHREMGKRANAWSGPWSICTAKFTPNSGSDFRET